MDRSAARLAANFEIGYNSRMIRDQIREPLDRDRFEPFRLILSRGRQYDILDPHMTVLMKSEMFIAFPDGEHSTLVPLLHLTAVETRANGGRTTRRKRR